MAFYIAVGGRTDLAAIEREAEAGLRPRHATGQLASLLNATVVQPDGRPSAFTDRLLSRLIGRPETWATARRLRSLLRPGDVVFCPDEAIGIPVATLCNGRGARIVMLAHNLVRPRAKTALTLLSIPRKVDLFMAVSRQQTDFLRDTYGVEDSRLLAISDQTDLHFFTPGESDPKPRPVIASAGLEKRDYRTLAAATADLDVDVRITGFSVDARVGAATFPDTLPPNMSRGRYSWPELRALYRTADIVVVSLYPNSYAAGIQGMLEAVASGTPVIVTRTAGLADYLDRPDLITTIDPGDAGRMRAAIEAKLADPAQAKRQAEEARTAFAPRIDSERYVAQIADQMRALTSN